MRKLLLAALFAALPSIVCPSIASAQGYIEGSVGFGLFPDIHTSGFSHNTPVVTPYAGLFEGNAQIQIDASWALGAEAGWRTGNWRFGASWDFIPAEANAARIEGTLNGVPFVLDATDQQLQDFGLDANYDVNVFAANAYYHFVGFGVLRMTADPYIGLGLGAATFSHLDAQFAFLATLGVNVPLGQSAYVGARYRATFISGPSRSDNGINAGIEFDGITTHAFSLILGFHF